MTTRPRGLLFDYGGTLVEEVAFNRGAGMEVLLAHAVNRSDIDVDGVVARTERLGMPMGVVSNSSFSQVVIRHELAKHGLAEFLAVVVVSAEYAVRKPNPLLFETAAALLDIPCADVWFVGDRLDTDVAGARAAGMTPILYGPANASGRAETREVAITWPEIVAKLRAGAPEGSIPNSSRGTLEDSDD